MRILGIDYGEKRLGLAVCDTDTRIATPWRVEPVRDLNDLAGQIIAAAQEARADLVVVGLPLNMDGTRGEMAMRVEALARDINESGRIQARTHDERLSSASVERMLIEADQSRRRRKEVRDKLAAQAMLQSYLDCSNRSDPRPET